MKTKFALFFLIVIWGISGCATATSTPTTSTPTLKPTETKTPLPSLTPSLTSSATNTPTLEPTQSSTFVPQNMLPGSLAISSILDTDCFYQRDSYDNKGAYIAFECPGIDVAWISIRFTNLDIGETATDIFGELPTEGVVVIEPDHNLEEDGNELILARTSDNEFAYFTIYETDNYVISVETFFPENKGTSLEDFYASNAEGIIEATLLAVIDNTKIATVPMPTLTAKEQLIADKYGQFLITQDFLSSLLDEDWELERYEVDYLGAENQMPGMCESFLSSLRKVSNCVNEVGANIDLDYLMNQWYASGWEVIQPTQSLEYDSAFYGIWDGSWIIQGYLLVDDYLIYVHFDGIHIGIGASIADALTKYVDNFVVEIMLKNVSKLP